jgi:hypothetical protein
VTRFFLCQCVKNMYIQSGMDSPLMPAGVEVAVGVGVGVMVGGGRGSSSTPTSETGTSPGFTTRGPSTDSGLNWRTALKVPGIVGAR